MAGYDDTKIIADVETLMRRKPDLSRRAAIIEIAGEGGLRRVERKMQQTAVLDDRKLIDRLAAYHALTGGKRSDVTSTDAKVLVVESEGALLEFGDGSRIKVSNDLLLVTHDRVIAYFVGGRLGAIVNEKSGQVHTVITPPSDGEISAFTTIVAIMLCIPAGGMVSLGLSHVFEVNSVFRVASFFCATTLLAFFVVVLLLAMEFRRAKRFSPALKAIREVRQLGYAAA